MIDKLKDLEFTDKDIIHFKEGIPAFEEFKDYVLIQEDDVPFLMTLQSVKAEIPSFVVIDPFAFMDNYSPILSESDLDFFGSNADLKFLLMTIIPKTLEDTVVNLKSPIVIDAKTNRAKQVISENKDYPIRYKLFNS